PPFYLVCRVFEVGVAESRTHNFKIEGVKPDGETFRMMEDEGKQFTLLQSETPESTSRSLMVVQMRMGVSTEGRYQFIILVDGQEMKRLDLKISIHAE